MSLISEVEVVVMEVLWQQVLCSVDDVVVVLVYCDWVELIIKILFNCLLIKGVIVVECDGWCYLYCLLLQCQVWVEVQSQDFIGCVFEGCVVLLVVYFSECGQLSVQDIVDLKKLIQELDYD